MDGVPGGVCAYLTAKVMLGTIAPVTGSGISNLYWSRVERWGKSTFGKLGKLSTNFLYLEILCFLNKLIIYNLLHKE